MGSVRGLLHEEEGLLAEVRPHPVVVVGPVLLVLLAVAGAAAIAIRYPDAPIAVAWLLAAMVALPAMWAAARFLRWRSVRLLVTTSRLLYRRGVLGRDVVQLRLNRVAEVHCSQSPGARMIGTGRLVFEVAGGDAPLVIEDVRRPRRLQRVINAQLDRLDASYGAYAGRVPYGAYDAYDGHGAYGGNGAYDGHGAYGGLPTGTVTAPSSLVVRDSSPPPARGTRPAGRNRRGRTWTDTPPHGTLFDDEGEEGPATVPRQLLQLDDLRRRGILSDAEFAAKKAELLGRL